MDWFGALGLVLLLFGVPSYLAQDPDARALGAWQDFDLPAPRIGDHVVFDLVVQVTNERPMRAQTVVEVVHRTPGPDEVPVPSVFVQEVRFHPAHVTLGPLVLRQNASVIREYVDAGGTVVWRTVEETIDQDGRALSRDTARRSQIVTSGALGSGARPQVVHEGDPEATMERLILERSIALFESLVIPLEAGKVGVRDRLIYEEMVLFGGEPIVYPAVARLLDAARGPYPCVPDDPHTYIGAGGIPYPSLADDPARRQPVPKEGGGFEPGPMFPGPHTMPYGTGSLEYHPGDGWVERRFVLPLGPHVVNVGLNESAGLCQGGMEHHWYHPDVPFPAGYHSERELRPDGDTKVEVDLVPGKVIRGEGAARPKPEERLPHTMGAVPLEEPSNAPRSVAHEEAAALPLEPAGPMIPLSALASDDRPLLGGRSIADVDAIVRAATNVSNDSRLLSFVIDGGNMSGAPPQWWTLYGGPDGSSRLFWVALGETPHVQAAYCLSDAHLWAYEHHLHLPCRPIDIDIVASDPLVTDPAWLWERATRQAAHSFSFDPLTRAGRTGPLAALYFEGFTGERPPLGRGGEARWSSGHVGPFHDTDTAPLLSWAAWDLADGRPLQQVELSADTAAERLAHVVPSTAEAATIHREPIMSPALAIGGLGLVGVALLARLVAALKTLLVYPMVSALYARIENDKVLAHERREELMQILAVDPGLTPSDIGRRLGWGWGATLHHLETLRRSGRLVRLKVGKSQHYFPPSVPDKATRLRHVILRNDDLARFLELVESEPGLSLKDLGARTGLRAPALSKMGSRLVAYGFVTKQRDGKNTRFQPTFTGMPSRPPEQQSIESDGIVA